jgi:hypothetical protein
MIKSYHFFILNYIFYLIFSYQPVDYLYKYVFQALSCDPGKDEVKTFLIMSKPLQVFIQN